MTRSLRRDPLEPALRRATGNTGRAPHVPRRAAGRVSTADDGSPASYDGRVLRGQRTRAKLLQAAIDLFGSRGFDAVGMRDIAGLAGVGAPAMYNHFPSKDAVLIAALTESLARFRATVITPDDPSAGARTRLEGLVRRHVRQQAESATAGSIDRLLDSVRSGRLLPDPAQRHEVETYLHDYRSLLGSVVGGVRTEDQRVPTPVLVEAIIRFCDSAPRWYPDAASAAAAAEDDCWRMVSNMLGAEHS